MTDYTHIHTHTQSKKDKETYEILTERNFEL